MLYMKRQLVNNEHYVSIDMPRNKVKYYSKIINLTH